MVQAILTSMMNPTIPSKHLPQKGIPLAVRSKAGMANLSRSIIATELKPVATPKLVRQKDKRGCAIACLSMITGIDYDQIGQELAEYHWKADGLTSRAADQYLADHGYAVQRRYPVHANGKPRQEWPALFTEIHICRVWGDATEPGFVHYVIVLRDGTVLDPEHGEPKQLTDYQGVHSIAGVYKCG